jgi:hypothetical protein
MTTKNKPLPVFLKPKGIKVVDKKALNKIADGIFNPKTGNYLNLCKDTLLNGEDPACEARSMHCGLGELYFVVTGEQPEKGKVNEGLVVAEVVARSTIHKRDANSEIEKAKEAIMKLNLPEELEENLLSHVEDFEFDFEDQFRSILDSIPGENDDVAGDNFKTRAKRVAAILRKAADLLP